MDSEYIYLIVSFICLVLLFGWKWRYIGRKNSAFKHKSHDLFYTLAVLFMCSIAVFSSNIYYKNKINDILYNGVVIKDKDESLSTKIWNFVMTFIKQPSEKPILKLEYDNEALNTRICDLFINTSHNSYTDWQVNPSDDELDINIFKSVLNKGARAIELDIHEHNNKLYVSHVNATGKLELEKYFEVLRNFIIKNNTFVILFLESYVEHKELLCKLLKAYFDDIVIRDDLKLKQLKEDPKFAKSLKKANFDDEIIKDYKIIQNQPVNLESTELIEYPEFINPILKAQILDPIITVEQVEPVIDDYPLKHDFVELKLKDVLGKIAILTTVPGAYKGGVGYYLTEHVYYGDSKIIMKDDKFNESKKDGYLYRIFPGETLRGVFSGNFEINDHIKLKHNCNAMNFGV